MFFYRRTIPGLAIQSYLLGDEDTRRAIVIDPVRDVDDYLQVAEQQGFEISDIVETHVHADYVSGAVELKSRLNGNPIIHSSGMGGEEWTPNYADHIVQDGDEVSIGEIRLKAIHTPGHTPEHIIWALFENGEQPSWLFSGDLLFVGDVGRPDLLGEEVKQKLASQLYQSIFKTLKPLSDSIEVFPAHGAGSLCGKSIGNSPSTTLGEERAGNPSLVEKPESEWIASLMDEMPVAPPYFPIMKKINVHGPQVLGPNYRETHPLSVDQVQLKMDSVIILDTRSKEAFSSAHIPGSINIPFGPSFSHWAGWVLEYEKSIVLILDEETNVGDVITALIRIGYDDVIGYLEGGICAWEDQGNELSHIEVLSVEDLSKKLQDPNFFLLDVRTDREWKNGHIQGAHHIQTGLVSDCLDMVPEDRKIGVICGSGYRASVAASVLKRAGYQDVANVFGGMTAWRERGLDVV